MKKTFLVTGSGGLIGSESAQFWMERGHSVVGIDNNSRRLFFGPDGSTLERSLTLKETYPNQFTFLDLDITRENQVFDVFAEYGPKLSGIVHAAAQPSHDWAARDPRLDFTTNSVGTLNLLEATRKHALDVPFVFLSTNKVYGDLPNDLPLSQQGERLELPKSHPYFNGIDETMSIDNSVHSLFGVSKLSADLLVQEYGRYFGLSTLALRGGTLTGEQHAAVKLHGFLAYLTHCALRGIPYEIIGYNGLQVRDVIHAWDVVQAINCFIEDPRVKGKAFNLGGGRANSLSVIEAIRLVESFHNASMELSFKDEARLGDHKWWITSNAALQSVYPSWTPTITINEIVNRMMQSVASPQENR